MLPKSQTLQQRDLKQSFPDSSGPGKQRGVCLFLAKFLETGVFCLIVQMEFERNLSKVLSSVLHLQEQRRHIRVGAARLLCN